MFLEVAIFHTEGYLAVHNITYWLTIEVARGSLHMKITIELFDCSNTKQADVPVTLCTLIWEIHK
jgi:hypothetical protein